MKASRRTSLAFSDREIVEAIGLLLNSREIGARHDAVLTIEHDAQGNRLWAYSWADDVEENSLKWSSSKTVSAN